MARCVSVQATHCTVHTQVFSLTLPDTPSTRKVAVGRLRSLSEEAGEPWCPWQQWAALVGRSKRQAASQPGEDCRACGQEMKALGLREGTVAEPVVEAVSSDVLQTPLATTEALGERGNARLDRTDSCWAHIEAALEQISCRALRRVRSTQRACGAAQYQESSLVDPLLYACENRAARVPGSEGPADRQEAPCVTDPTAIRTLLSPGAAMEAVPACLRWIGGLMTRSSWGVPLARLGPWTGGQTSPVLRGLLGVVRVLFPRVQDCLKDKIHACVVLVDETWLTLRGTWSDWCVASEAATGLPLVSSLSQSRSAWVCRDIGVTLRGLGIRIKALVTDGLASYPPLLPAVVPQVCLLHHQQGVWPYGRDHRPDTDATHACQQEMLKVVKTTEKRTVRRRLETLAQRAAALGIGPWIEKTLEKLSQWLPAIGSRTIPRTTNGIARFFRTFTRFYKTRCGFHSLRSARWALALLILGYLFTKQEKEGIAPLEAILPQASALPLYRMINDPFAVLLGIDQVKLPQKMAHDHMAIALAA